MDDMIMIDDLSYVEGDGLVDWLGKVDTDLLPLLLRVVALNQEGNVYRILRLVPKDGIHLRKHISDACNQTQMGHARPSMYQQGVVQWRF